MDTLVGGPGAEAVFLGAGNKVDCGEAKLFREDESAKVSGACLVRSDRRRSCARRRSIRERALQGNLAI